MSFLLKHLENGILFITFAASYKYAIMRVYKVIEVIKLLEADGWILMAIKGDHRQYKHPTKKGKVTIRGHKIIVNVSWCNHNFGASLSENVPGAIALTAKTYDELLDEVRQTLNFHIEGMIADGDDVPQWLRNGDYEFEYRLDAAALLQMCAPYASIAAISRVSGINQHQLSHYANGLKHPRPQQRRRIVEGLHKIGRELISVE